MNIGNLNDAGAGMGCRYRGFTLFELILIIAVLGILAISALPRFLNLSESTEEMERDGVMGAVRAGIAMYHTNHLADQAADKAGDEPIAVWPPVLDEQGPGPCTDCFSAVLQNGVNDSRWVRGDADMTYTFTTSGGKKTVYSYDPATGRLAAR